MLVIGPVPPPVCGLSLAVQRLLQSDLSHRYCFVPINTAIIFAQIGDQGKFRSIKAIRDAILFLRVLKSLVRTRPCISYLTIAQTRLGILRDAALITLCRLFRTPVVIHLHGGHFRHQYEGLHPLEQRVVAHTLSLVDRVIVLSDSFRSLFDGLVDAGRIRVVHNGVPDIPVLHPSSSDSLEYGLHVLFLSNLQREKGLFDALYALWHLKERGIPFRATFAGAWPSVAIENQARHLVSQLELGSVVHFPGLVIGQLKTEVFSCSDVFIFPSYQMEGQPIALIEAMRAGLPVVATSQGSIPEMVADGKNGFLVPKHCPEAIADKLALLAQKPLLRAQMGQASRQRYLETYTEHHYIRGLEAVFGEVLKTIGCSS